MTNRQNQLLQLLESLRGELANVTLESDRAAELARLMDAIEVQVVSKSASAGADAMEDGSLDAEAGVGQSLLDDLNREAASMEIEHPDTVATVRTLINMLANLGL